MKLVGWLPEFVKAITALKDLWLNEALNGDATETVAKVFLVLLNRQNGNITEREFNVKLNILEKEWTARMLDVY